jgi:hypothetical protein
MSDNSRPRRKPKREYNKWKEKLKKSQQPKKPHSNKGIPQPAKSRLTSELQKRIESGVAGGNFSYVVARYEGISNNLFHAWMAKGKAESDRRDKLEDDSNEPDHIYYNFYVSILKAESYSEMRAVKILMNPDGSNVVEQKWAAWWLERNKRDRWSPTKDVNLHGPNNGPIEIKQQSNEEFFSQFTASEIDAIGDILITAKLRRDNEQSSNDESIPVLPSSVGSDRSQPLP